MTQVEMSGRRERKKAATRAKIVEAATDLFRKQGYHATSIEAITGVADVAPRTFYSYFDAKVDVALAQFEVWAERHLEALEARPAGETPEEMEAGALEALRKEGYLTSERLRDHRGRPYPPIAVAVVLSETEPEVAGRILQVMVTCQGRMAELFRRRYGFAEGAVEPRVIAAAMTATWFVSVYGFADVCAVDPDPPSIDELGLAGLGMLSAGLSSLVEGRLAR